MKIGVVGLGKVGFPLALALAHSGGHDVVGYDLDLGLVRDRLAKLNGAEFDKAYANEMVKDHKKDVADFKRQAKSAKDPDLKSWAGKTLPTLEDHLKQAQDMQAQVKSAPRAAR